MKKFFVLMTFMLIGIIGFSQVKKKPAVTTAQAAILKTNTDSLSYAIGVSVASFYKEQGIQKVNTTVLARAVNDALANSKLQMNEQQCNKVLISFVQKNKSEKSSGNRKLGEAFLAENKTKPGVITLPSGLQYTVVKEGTGPKPTATDKIKCHYHGTLIDGTVFDSSIQRGEPLEIGVSQVIRGWTEALQLMPVGSKWRIFIPSELGYGDQQAGAIPPGSTLIFDLELLDIVK